MVGAVKRALVLALALAACVPEPKPQPIPPLTVAIPAPQPTIVEQPGAIVPPLPYPATRRDQKVDVLHGTEVADPYRWLEDGKNDEVKEWASAQDKLTRAELAKSQDREAIAARLKELFYVESMGVPRKYGARYV